MIESIELTNCVPYKQEKLSDCKKVNFIYGSNGSGKSTISALLAGENDPRLCNSTINWSNESHESIYVYNRHFRNKNIQQVIPGVFTMGSATIEEINLLEQKKKDLVDKKEDYERKTGSYRKVTEIDIPTREKKFKDDVWERILKANESDFQKAFEGFRNSKDKFLAELNRRMSGVPNHEGKVCQRNQLVSRANTLFASDLQYCAPLVFDVQNLIDSIENIRTNHIWDTVIVGNDDVDIAALINELGNSSWVDQGRQYLRQTSRKCPFCQKETISDDFVKKLELVFDREYKRQMDLMRFLTKEYSDLINNVLSLIDSILSNEECVRIGNINIDSLSSKKDNLKLLCSDNDNKMNQKIAEPTMKIVLSDASSSIQEVQSIVLTANSIISEHNKLVERQETEVEKLKDDIWATVIHDADSLIKAYQKEIADLNKAAKGIERTKNIKKNEIDSLQADIIESSKNVTSVQPAIDEINRLLCAYGFTSFSIQPADGKENYYCIKRDDGSLATGTLSEGEETFLSFLYFMQQAKGSTDPNHVSDKRILVLDDPISSLDSTILYIVGAMVKQLSYDIRNGIGDVNQLFVLTHNVFFHKETSFIDGQTKVLKDVNYWIVRKDDGVSTVYSYGMTNPISTSYELLWQELRDNKNLSCVTIQNIMRRIIENYFGMLGNKKDEKLLACFDNPEERVIARSLIAWINDGSHSIPDDLYIDSYTDAVPKYKDVFRRIFYNTDNSAHYNMMMRIEENEEHEPS